MPLVAHDRKQRAFVLLIVISLMAVLSILATSFAMMSRIERHISANYVDMVRAKMLATAGADAAMLRIRGDATQKMYDAASDPWFYAGTYVGGLPVPATKLENADFPSYRAGTMTVDGQTRGYSGALAGTYQSRGDTYALKVSDLAGRININGRETRLAEMLDALGRGILALDGRPDPVRGRGAMILNRRNTQFGGSFKAVDDMLGVISSTDLDTLRDYISIYSWVDRGVAEPTPQSPGSWPVENYDFRMTPMDTTLNPPQPYGRHPVNVNTAPLPCVFACLTGLSARIIRSNSLQNVPQIADAAAANAARAIGRARQAAPFRTWDQFESWVDTNLNMISQDQRAIVCANANPNTRLNKFAPDTIGVQGNTPYGLIADKTDLTFHTTEFSFSSYGWFQIESLGRVLDANSRTVASAKLRTVVKLFDAVRHTSQSDFVTAAQGTGTFRNTRTFPENMEDQNWSLARASTVDGKIQIMEDEILEGNEVYYRFNDDTLCPKLHPRRVHERWYSNIHDQGRARRYPDLCENQPADAGMANVPNQNPFDRSVTNSMLAASYRNSTWGSDLLPDGHILNRRRNKLIIEPGCDPHGRKAYINPQSSSVNFWMKQDLSGGPMDAFFCQCIPGKDERIPSGPGGGHDIWGYFFATPWINGAHVSMVTAGQVLPQCRRSNVRYPFGSDFGWLDFNPFRGLIPPRGQWNWMRVEIDNYTTIRIYVNGTLIRTSTPYAWGTWTYNATNILDITEFGYLFLHSAWQFDWDYRADGVFDTIRIYDDVNSGRNHPYRFPPSNGGAYFEGSFDFASLPNAATRATLLAIGYTQFRPRVQYSSGAWRQLGNSAPYVDLLYKTPTGAWTSGGSVGDGVPIAGGGITPGQKLSYRLRFFDNGLTPTNVAAYADDVTVFYTTGPQIMSWGFDPN